MKILKKTNYQNKKILPYKHEQNILKTLTEQLNQMNLVTEICSTKMKLHTVGISTLHHKHMYGDMFVVYCNQVDSIYHNLLQYNLLQSVQFSLLELFQFLQHPADHPIRYEHLIFSKDVLFTNYLYPAQVHMTQLVISLISLLSENMHDLKFPLHPK